jgi:hypothetical protein
METLIVADPEDAAAKLPGFPVEEIRFGREDDFLANRDRAADVFPVIMIEIPGPSFGNPSTASWPKTSKFLP